MLHSYMDPMGICAMQWALFFGFRVFRWDLKGKV